MPKKLPSEIVFESTEKDYPTTTAGKQISEAMDKTATAITEAAHNKVVERVRKGEEIVYKKPDAIERAKQDDRYQVEINDKGHAVVKNIKDSNGEWVKPQANVAPIPKTEAVHIENGKAEEVTPEIIRESLAKVDDKPVNGKTMSLKEAKQWLLDQVSTAIAVAPANKLDNKADDLIGLIEGLDTSSERVKNKDQINAAKKELESYYITFDVPNDGVFKVLNNVESLQKFKKKVEVNRGFDKQSPKKVFPSVAQNSADTTIAEFLSDGEVENAYEFAKLQDKPIRFGVGQSNGKPIALAYALAEPVDLGDGFKGFVGLSLDKKNDKKEWMFIEENSRLSIGFGSPTKLGIIKEAKERLAKVSDDQKANMLKNSPRSEKTDAEFEQQWLSQIGYNPNQNDDEVKADVKAKAEDKQNKAIGDEIFNQDPEKVTTKVVDEKPTDSIIKVEYPTATVLNGWQNSIRNANEVVRSFKRAYEDYINDAYNGALSQAETDLQKKVLERESLKLQQEYIKRTVTLAQIRSGVTSSFIAGGSNFNNKQAQNRSNAFDKASRDFENWLLGNKYTLSTAVQEARSPEQLAAIKAEKDAKAQKLQDKNDAFLRKVLSFKKGDDFTIGKNKVVRVNVNKYGMPISLTLEGVGITKGLDDKINLFGKNMSYETVDELKQNIERIKEADSSIVEEKSKTGLVDEDKLKNLEISVNDFISANGLDPDNYDFSPFGETQEKTQYQTLISEMLDVAEKHIAAARSKFTSTPEQRKQKAKTLSTWTGAVDAIKLIAKNYDNPFLTRLAARRDIPASLKTRFEKKFANLSDSEKYMQWEEQAKLSAIHRANKAIEWVLKEKSKEADATKNEATPVQDSANPFEEHNLIAKKYGYSVDDTGTIFTPKGKNTEVRVSKKSGRLEISNNKGVLFTSANPAEFGKFLESYWYAEKSKETDGNAQAAKPTPVTQPESKPTPIASTSSSDLTDEEYIALKKAYNDFKAKTDKIGVAYSRDVALEIATGLVAEMPDKEDKIRQALIDAIRENQWNRFEINFPKQPIKVETDVELNRALKRLQKALEGTDYTVNGTFNGKSAKLLFSYKSGANASRESVLIDRVNGKFTSYHVDFDNMSREVLKPLMDATVKWLNGEEIPKMKLGDDSQWDYTTLLSTPRHIDNAFNEAKTNAPTATPVSKSDKLAQSFDEAKAKQQPTNEDKPKFSRKATESDSVPIYRIDNKNFDANNIKPHGLYVSIPSDVSTFDSPHKDVGDTSFAGNASPKNPLNVESFKIQHKRGNDYPMEVSAGVSALKQLVSVQLFERLIKADKAELTATIKEQFPDIDTSQYYDAYELLEVLGAQLAIQEGYDAIIQKNGNDQFNEMVILDNSIIDSMSPTDKPKNSKGTGEGLTTTQTRAILVKHFGEKLIKALESSGLLTIMATPPSWAKPDADGAYHNGKSYLFTDNLSAETVVATLAHELSGHKGFQELMTPTAYDSLMRQFNRLVKQGNAIALAAKARAEAAEVVTPTADTKEAIALAEKQTLQRQQDELLPYLLTQQATLNATRSQQSAVTKVIEQVYRAVKAWLYRTLSAHGFDGVASKLLQPKDITLLAERMIREMGNGTNPSNNTKAKGSQFSQLNTPQTQINAVRKKYEGTSQWMKAPNGQPTKLNEMQWLQVRTPNFKAWFGDFENDPKNASQVVDENGEPMVVYHGSDKSFNEFMKGKNRNKRAGSFEPNAQKSYWFSNNKFIATKWANGTNGSFLYPDRFLYEVFLNIKNPNSVDMLQVSMSEGEKNHLVNIQANPSDKAVMPSTEIGFRKEAVVTKALTAGNDGVYFKNGYDGHEYYGDIIAAFTPEQIKSATGNTGEFNPTNPDIRFSRGDSSRNESPQNDNPNQQNNNKKLNSLLHGWLDGKGEDVFNAMSASIKGVLSKMPASMALVDNAPPAFKQMMREMLRDSKQAELAVSDILKNSTSLKAEERTLLSDYLEKELALGVTPPEDVVKVGAAMRMALSYQTEELVRLGMLSEESAARWRDTYLPRLYKERQKDPLTKAIVKRFDIKGDHLKGRGQYREVETSKVADYVKSGWEDRGVSSRGKTIVWRDYTKRRTRKNGRG